MDNFLREKQVLASAFTKNLEQLCEKYEIGLESDTISDAVDKLLTRNLKKSVRERELDDNMDTDGSNDEAADSDNNSSGTSSPVSSESENYTLVQKRKPRSQPLPAQDKRAKIQDKPAETLTSGNYYNLIQPKEPEAPPKSQAPAEKKIPRPPPIICYNLNVAHFYEELEKVECQPKFFLKNTNKTRCTIKPATESDRQVLFAVVQRVKVDCHTFTPKDSRKVTLVLKGVQCSFEPEQVLEALKVSLPEMEIEKVTRLVTPLTKKNGHLNAYVVTFACNSDVNAIVKVNRLLYQVVHWEKFRNSGISQCKNCQKFGHVASNCGSKYKCVKCNVSHGPGECPRDPKEGAPYCNNCNTQGHPANYRGCPKYKEILERRKLISEEKRRREHFVRESAMNFVQPGKSFAQIVNNTNKQPPKTNITNPKVSTPKSSSTPSNLTVDDFIYNEGQRLLGVDLFTLMGKIKSFLPQFEKLKSDSDRQSAYIKFAMSLCMSKK